MPAVATSPYDVVDTILNFARVIANDCALSLSGNLLADSQPYTFTMLNLAWRKLQDKLENNSIEAFPAETVLVGVTAIPSPTIKDMGVQAYIDFNGYNDGFNSNAIPFLPADLEMPTRLWERQTGVLGNFYEMRQSGDGLPTRSRVARLVNWEWRDEKIYLVGSNQSNDIRLRYKKRIQDIITGTDPIPLLRCATALAYLTVEIFADGRGSTVSKKFSDEKDDAIKQLINSTTRQKQRTNFRRQGYSRRGNRRVW